MMLNVIRYKFSSTVPYVKYNADFSHWHFVDFSEASKLSDKNARRLVRKLNKLTPRLGGYYQVEPVR